MRAIIQEPDYFCLLTGAMFLIVDVGMKKVLVSNQTVGNAYIMLAMEEGYLPARLTFNQL